MAAKTMEANEGFATSDTPLASVTAEVIQEITIGILFSSEPEGSITLKDCSGRSGTRGFLVMKAGTPVAML